MDGWIVDSFFFGMVHCCVGNLLARSAAYLHRTALRLPLWCTQARHCHVCTFILLRPVTYSPLMTCSLCDLYFRYDLQPPHDL